MSELGNEYANELLYEKDGHLFTTFIVAVQAGKSVEQALQLAWGSQIPDENGSYTATRGALRAWFSSYAKRLMMTLHSLHGQGPAGVAKRRNDLKTLITGSFEVKVPEWRIGLMVHAFADSYAHTFAVTGGERAYSPPTGHFRDGHTPDQIRHDPEKYLAYAASLYQAFGGQGDPLVRLHDLAGIVTDGAREAEIAENIEAYAVSLGMAPDLSARVRQQLLNDIGVADVDETMRVMEQQFGLQPLLEHEALDAAEGAIAAP